MYISITKTTHPGTLLPSDQLGFGIHYTDHMFIMDYSDEKAGTIPVSSPSRTSLCPLPPVCSITAPRSLKG